MGIAAPRLSTPPARLRSYRAHGRPVAIAGLGVYLPERVLTNQELERTVETSDQWITERSGIRERRLAEPGTPTFELAARAASNALDDAGISAEEVDLILVATSSPDGPFPSVACRVQERLGASGGGAVDLLGACSGFTYALSVAEAYVAGERADTVLVIGAEVLSRLVDWRDRNTCILFGDGAGAAVVRPATGGAGFLSWCLGADGRGYDRIWCGDVERGAYAAQIPQPHIGMDGAEVFRFAIDIFIRQAATVAEAAGLTIDDIDLWVPHQANRRIIEAAARRVGLPMDRVMVNIERYGNTSTATIPLALHDAVTQGRLASGDRVLLAGFGAGLTWGACLLEWGS
ncbi:MAG TPA: beta-ketoacyl-ACP synthase III [Candidatus Dormibacteraeota bacterium]|nr:beta-ketoacyl-ACP synthase III [Candidatus Dormibacteraeota bacterium]